MSIINEWGSERPVLTNISSMLSNEAESLLLLGSIIGKIL
jgi:hypothetical protein